MNGPEHYREGEERMRASDYQWQEAHNGDVTGAMHEAAMAQAHFLAAIAAVLAADRFPDSRAWQEAIG
jgi:hypothetical protein